MQNSRSTYSRAVAALKYLLPLFALVLMSLIFLVSRDDLEGGIQFSLDDLETLDDGLQMDAPKFSVLIRDGGTLSITADWALPEDRDNSRVTFGNIVAQLTDKTDRETRISAANGDMRPPSDQLLLDGNLRILLPDNGEIITEKAEINTATGAIVMPLPVRATTPRGQLTAQSAQFLPQGDETSRNSVIRFEGMVKLRFKPATSGTDSP